MKINNRPPQRTCVSCRREGQHDSFLRFVLDGNNALVVDIAGKLPGRGAYVCATRECLGDALKRRQFHRSFKKEIRVPLPDELIQLIVGAVQHRIGSLIALANKAGMVISGSDAVERALQSASPADMLLIARDTSEDRRKKFTYSGERAGCRIATLLSAAEIGALLGKEQRSFILCKSSGITSRLSDDLERFRNFMDGGTQEL